MAPLLHVTAPGLLAGLVLTAGAGVLPDIDEPGSTIARSYGFLTETFAWIVHHLSGGHRKGTHSVIGVLVFTAGAWAAVHFDHSLAGKIALGVFLSPCCCRPRWPHCTWAGTTATRSGWGPPPP